MTSLPPGPRGHPITGVLNDYRRDPLGFFSSCARDYGDFVPMRFGPKPAFLISHPDLIDEILVQQYRSFVKGPALRNNRLVFGNGLLTSEGDFWRRQRRLAQPAFHRNRIAEYAEVMVDVTQRRIGDWRNGEIRDIHAEMMRITMEIAARTLFGVGVEGIADEVGASMTVLQEGAMRRFSSPLQIGEWFPTPTNLRLQRTVRKLNRIVYGFIGERRANGTDSGDLLSSLLAAQDDYDGGRMTDRQLRDEVLTLFLAGHETTALALTWTMMLLAQNPGVEEVLAKEVATLGGYPTIEDRARLSYAANVVLESMRLYPPAWAIARTATERVEMRQWRIPKGAMILMLPYIVHRDPRWFPNPEQFDPDRWRGDFASSLPRQAYFPFGGGPRTCIGNSFAIVEAVLILGTLIRQYRLSLVTGHPIVLQPAITLRPKQGIRMIVAAR